METVIQQWGEWQKWRIFVTCFITCRTQSNRTSIRRYGREKHTCARVRFECVHMRIRMAVSFLNALSKTHTGSILRSRHFLFTATINVSPTWTNSWTDTRTHGRTDGRTDAPSRPTAPAHHAPRSRPGGRAGPAAAAAAAAAANSIITFYFEYA